MWSRGGFQSTLPHGERQSPDPNLNRLNRFQSTLPHGERPTYSRNPGRKKRFQSTLPHGERPCSHSNWYPFIFCFNPRSRMGSDDSIKIHKAVKIVSIHAPAWGATRSSRLTAHSVVGFNPRSRMGSDLMIPMETVLLIGFNPRSRMGSDQPGQKPILKPLVSIHAPAWGAT